jgi:hypothetical protein
MELKKATLRQLPDQPSASTPKTPAAVPVQINPASLRLQASASVDTGKNANRQRSQYQGTTSTLTFDLVFDTADEGTTDAPVDVRTRTAAVEKFVWPAAGKSSPPRVEFTYGTFSVVGVMTAVNVDLDLFSSNGVPLRAKCSVTIKEQRLAFDLTVSGAGAKTALGATPPVGPSTGVAGLPGGGPGGAGGAGPAAAPGTGTGGPAPADRTGTALAGETASGFATRMGLDPRAWKGLQGLADPLRLEAGQQIDFSSSLSADLGLGGTTSGIGAALADGGLGAAADAAAGTGTVVPGTATAAAIAADPVALTAAGGLTRALSATAAAAAAQAAAAAGQAFGVGPGPPSATTSPASGGPAPGAGSGATGTTAPVPVVDRRAVSYGFGVPLRPRRITITVDSLGLVHERTASVRRGGTLPPESTDVTVPGWQALPSAAPAGAASTGCSCRSGGATCGREC